MPQLLNMLAAAPKESQSAKMGNDSQSLENNGFSNVLADEKSKVDSPRASETPQKQMHSDKQETPESKQKDSAEKTDANLILRQIKMGEDLEKGQNIAADGKDLPLDGEEEALIDGEASSGDELVSEESLLNRILSTQGEDETSKKTSEPSDWLWPVDESVEEKEVVESELVTVSDDEEVSFESLLLSADKKADLEDNSDEVLEEENDVLMTSAPISASGVDGKASPVSSQGNNAVDNLTLEAKRDELAQSQLSKANLSLVTDEESAETDETSLELDKKVNRILGAATGEGKSRLSSETSLTGDMKVSDKSILTKDQLAGTTESGVDKEMGKFGFKNSVEMSEKVANFQTQQIARENGLGIAAESSARESSSFSTSSLSSVGSLSSHQGGAQTQVVQLSLRQGGEAPAQMQEMIQRFNPVMKQQLVTMVKNGVQQAEIRLDPPELGSMMVRVQVQGDQTQVQFQAAQSQTREMLEQALPKLRDMLSEQGMELTDSQVSQENHSQQNGGEQSYEGNESASVYDVNEISAEDLPLGTNQATSYTSGIDYYA